jgi:uncharacterized repeat protein (TIGR02543 family)
MIKKMLSNYYRHRLFWPINIGIVIIIIICLLLGITLSQNSDYRITFNAHGGTPVEPIVTKAGQPISEPTSTKLGHTFLSWHQDENYEDDAFVFDKMPRKNITLHANWLANDYTITFVVNGGSEIDPITATYGSSLVEPDAPTMTGATFLGWYSNLELTNAYTFPTNMPASDQTVYAKWDLNDYTITFETNGGSTIDPITLSYGSAISLPSVPIKLESNFLGWYSDANLTTAFTFPPTMPAYNQTIYAKWDLNEYSITFDTTGGSSVAVITADYGSIVNAPLAPTRTGYEFQGWYGDSALEIPFSFPTTMPAYHFTLYAKWTINQYTITFDTNGGSSLDPIHGDYASAITLGTTTKTGYTFIGWYSDEALTISFTQLTMPSQNMTLYSKWSINQYTISFHSNGGSAVSSITADYGATVEAPVIPTLTEGVFLGWYSDFALTTPFVFPTTMPAYSQTLYAKWQMNQYTISFVTNGGNPIGQLTANYGSNLSLTSPTKIGYTFAGWYLEEMLVNPFTDTTMPNHDLTLYAHWTLNQYTLSFVTNGGSSISSITADYASAYTQPTAPTKTGYTFAGWYQDSALTISATLPETMPAQNQTYYAKWTINSYRVSIYATKSIISTQIDSGKFHTMFLANDGKVYGSGANASGQLGNDSSDTSNAWSPVTMDTSMFLPDETVVEVYGGTASTTHIRTSLGRYFGMGDNASGEIGDGTYVSKNLPTLLDLSNLLPGEEIASFYGGRGGLFITNQNRIFSWGFNGSGQIGNGTTTSVNKPTPITLPDLHVGEVPLHLSTSGSHVLVLTSEYRVFTWGYNTGGILGLGIESNTIRVPNRIAFENYIDPGDYVVKVFATTTGNSFAVTNLGHFFAWGMNYRYTVGNGSTTTVKTPTKLTINGLLPGEEFVTIDSSSETVIALTNQNRLFGWGTPSLYQLGNASTSAVTIPTLISIPNFPSDKTIIDITATNSATLVLASNGKVYGAGFSGNGELGNKLVATKQIFETYVPETKDVYLMNQVDFIYGASLATLPQPMMAEKQFVGWHLNQALTNPLFATTMPGNDLTLYVQWSA